MKQKRLNVNSGITVLQGGEDVKKNTNFHANWSHSAVSFLNFNHKIATMNHTTKNSII
jgi:hypothetical protein